MKKKLFVAAGIELAIIAVAFVMYAMLDGEKVLRARQTLTFIVMIQAVAVFFAPLFGAERAARGGYRRALLAVLEPAGWTLAVCLSGPLLLALCFDRGALLAWLLAAVVSAGAALASAGLVLALARLTRKPLASASLAAALLLLFSLQPLYTLPAIRKSPRAQRLLINLGVRPPWMGVAHAMKLAKPRVWQYDLGSPTLYPPNWIGTDYRVIRPGPGRHFLEYLIFAAVFAGLAALRPGEIISKEAPEAPADNTGPE